MTGPRVLLISSIVVSSFALAACEPTRGGAYRGAASVHVGYRTGGWYPWYRPPVFVPPTPGIPIEPPIDGGPPVAVQLPEPDFGGDFGGGGFDDGGFGGGDFGAGDFGGGDFGGGDLGGGGFDF